MTNRIVTLLSKSSTAKDDLLWSITGETISSLNRLSFNSNIDIVSHAIPIGIVTISSEYLFAINVYLNRSGTDFFVYTNLTNLWLSELAFKFSENDKHTMIEGLPESTDSLVDS